MNGKISVIIPVYMVEKYLNECVESVTGQTYSNLEIILVDDGSKDNCPLICDEWANRDSRIKVIHKENGGLSDARNAGIEKATGDYIAFVDSDDWIKEDMYAKMLDALQKENADFCACNITSCYDDHTVSWGASAYTVGDSQKILAMLYDNTKFPVAAWNKLYKRDCWNTIRFPKGKLCEDAFTTYLLVHNAGKIVQIIDPLYCYRIRPQSIMTSSFSKKKMDEEEAWRQNYDFVKTHYPSLRKKALDFYLQKVSRMILNMTPAEKKEFSTEYRYLKGIQKKNLPYVLIKSDMSSRQRARYFLDFLKG